MAPKPKVEKERIVETAFEHVRLHGWDGLTARYLAERLGISTKPLYFHFPSMKAVEEMVVKKAMDMILGYMMVQRTGDPWIDHAVGVVMFSLEEKPLFRAIFDERHVEARKKHSVPVWKAGEAQLSDYPLFQGLSKREREAVRRARWIFVHGMASLMSISNWPWQKENEPQLHALIRRISRAVYNEFQNDPDILLNREHFQQPSAPEVK